MEEVLIVEDSRLFSNMLARRIRGDLHLPVRVAQSFEETRQLLARGQHDFFIALCDLNLPDAQEGEVLDFVVEHQIPSVIFTAEFSDAVQELAQKKQVVDYVFKEGPHSVDYLVSLVERIQRNAVTEVLVVDDSRMGRRHLRMLLERHRYQVLEAANGVEALEVFQANPGVALVLTDYNMPRMDGFELTTRIRAKYSMERVAIIGLSAADDERLSVRFLKHGANDFISKPFLNDQLYCRVAQNLRLVEQFRRLSDQNDQLEAEVRERARAERELREKEMQHRQLIELLPDPVVLELEGSITLVNRAVLDLLREEDRDRLLGRSITDFCAPESRASVAAFMESALRQGGLTERIEATLRRADNGPVHVTMQGMCYLSEGKVGLQLAMTDITAQKERETMLTVLSERDALTGLPNRRALDARIERVWELACAQGTAVGIALMDIDHFKKYNDSLGHQAGDRCLARVAEALAGACRRGNDFVARYGGEEFVAVLPDTSRDTLARSAERLRRAVLQLQLPHPASATADVVTVSVGAALASEIHHCPPGELIKAADAALYEAKGAGRNRVVLQDRPVKT